MTTNLSERDSLVSVWMQELRDLNIQTNREQFRKNLERIGQVAAYQISKTLNYNDLPTNTQLGVAHCRVIGSQPVVATIIRAGLPLFNGIMSFFDKADCAFVGAYRQHHADNSFEINQGYIACPSLEGRPLILADPMLATGASMNQTLASLLQFGKPSSVHIVSVIASTTGVATVREQYHEALLWIGAIDNDLDENKYIVPGLGDAGDLCYGEKLQH
jgi:uracil phosphoribosyltransferase